ncbi:MAG: (2Fe-2S)-binding protein [Planctomycetota bacterium]
MRPDDNVCYCFRVSLRKLVNYARRERPRHASQMSECLDAGSGCGWCIPFLKRIWEDPDGVNIDETPEEYAARRATYREAGAARNEF